MNRLRHQQAAACGTGLAGVLDYAFDDGRYGQVQVSVREYDLRRLAAQFQATGNVMAGGGSLNTATVSGEPVKLM
jgi:hypothetical protein